jgi:hypothetical protein
MNNKMIGGNKPYSQISLRLPAACWQKTAIPPQIKRRFPANPALIGYAYPTPNKLII